MTCRPTRVIQLHKANLVVPCLGRPGDLVVMVQMLFNLIH